MFTWARAQEFRANLWYKGMYPQYIFPELHVLCIVSVYWFYECRTLFAQQLQVLVVMKQSFQHHTRAFRKVPDLVFCENLHEVTLNPHTHAWILSHLSVASVDGQQHLSEVMFSASSNFYCQQSFRPSSGGKKGIPEEPEVAGSLANHRSLVFRKKVRGMCWSIIVMEAPIACWPQLLSLAPHIT